MIPESQIDDIINQNDLVDLVGEYTQLRKSGNSYKGLCPFHREKTPSFFVQEEKQIFKCFGCEKGGNAVHFVMLAEGLDYRSALLFLANRAGITVETTRDKGRGKIRQDIISLNKETARYFYSNLATNRQAQSYCYNRGIGEATIKTFGIGYALDAWDGLTSHLRALNIKEDMMLKAGLVIERDKGRGVHDKFRNRLMFPIFDVLGNVIAFGGRILDETMPKYLNSPETPVYTKSNHLYALNFARKSESKRVFVVEGYMDCISLYQGGITEVVASLGTAFTNSQAKLLKKYFDEAIITYDADAAGQSATIRSLDILQNQGFRVKVLSLPDGYDPDDYIKKRGKESFLQLADKADTLVEYKVRLAEKRWSPNSLDTKIEFLKDLITILAQIDNAVERDMYVKRFSEKYNIPLAPLKEELEKRLKGIEDNFEDLAVIKRGKTVSLEKSKVVDRKLIQRDRNEKLLLLLLSEDVNVLIKKRKNIDTSIFNLKNKELYIKLLNRYDKNEKMGTSSVLNDADVDDAPIITDLLEKWLTPPDIEKACDELIEKMEKSKDEDQLESLYALLRNRDIDEKKRTTILKEIDEIVKKRGQANDR